VAQSPAYVRTEEAPKLRAPANLVGWRGWIMVNLFPNWSNAIITIVAGLFVYWVLSSLLGWAIFRAVWTGANRDACAVEGAGACWPFVQAKFLQWVYGFYPIDQRWRVNMCFFVGACALIPLLIPSMPFKKWNVLFLLVVFPLLALILLTGGNFALAFTTFVFAVCALALIAAMLPLSVFGIEEGLRENKMAFWLAAVGLVLWLSNLLFRFPEVGTPFGDVPLSSLVSGILLIAGGACGIMRMSSIPSAAAHSTVVSWLVVVAVVLLSMFVLRVDFGLEFVETSQWGGLLVTFWQWGDVQTCPS
jgi:general L-amino acid transport system permease protein